MRRFGELPPAKAGGFWSKLRRTRPDADAIVLYCQTVADTHLGGVKPGFGAEPREPVSAAEEGLERLVEPAQHLLFGTARPSRQIWQFLPNLGQGADLVIGADRFVDRGRRRI